MAELDSSMYADSINRKYPINSKTATLQSYVDAVHSGDINMPLVQDGLCKAASFYGITRWPEEEKPQDPVPEQITYQVGDGTLSMSKIATTDDVKAAVDFI